MKEASGELSMTAVAVVAITAVGVLFTTLVWPSIKGSITRTTQCASAFSCTNSEAINSTDKCTNKTCWCQYYLESGAPSTVKIQCNTN